VTKYQPLQLRDLFKRESSPCQSCRFAERCQADQLACDSFAVYLAGKSETRWRMAPRAPTRGRFEALFGER
jgi:hypothetical protein